MTNSIPNTDVGALIIDVPSTMMSILHIAGLRIMCRAFFERDMAAFIFGAFVFASAFALVDMLGFLNFYNRIRKYEKSTKLEKLTRFTVWFLATVVLFGNAIKFVVYMPAALVDVLIYCLVIASSLLLFHVVHNIRDYPKKI